MGFYPRRTDGVTMGLDIETVLVPVDPSEKAEQALSYALALAERYGASVHALHVIDETVARGLETGDIEPDAVAEDHREFFDAVAEDATVPVSHSTAVGFSSKRLSQHPGSVILDVAEELPADFIVVPRETTGDPDEAIGKSAQYVLQYASQPVLSV
jgi:nucleotide-binding universal stress UspA family protein